MKKYLIVKTGKRGATINQLYDARPITANNGTIKITGNYRLAGDLYQGIIQAVKDQGHTGTFAVFEHESANADALMRSSTKTLLALTNGLKWDIIGTLQAEDYEDLAKKIYTEEREQLIWQTAVEEGLIEITGPTTYRVVVPAHKDNSRYQRNEHIKSVKATLKQRRYDWAATRIRDLITYRITDTVQERPTTFNSLFE